MQGNGVSRSNELPDAAPKNRAAVELLGHQAYPLHPWRNGRGVLRHIADGDGWQLRLADIDESGPFSDFSGHLRLFAIVEGAVVLEMPDGRRIECDPSSEVAVFDGGAAPRCQLVSGPAKAFNLIVEPDKVVASLERQALGRTQAEAVGDGGEFLAVHVQSGQVECRWRSSDGSAPQAADRPVVASAKDTLMPMAEAGVWLRAAADADAAVVLIARIRPAGTLPPSSLQDPATTQR